MLILILVFLSMVHEYAYFFMNTFGNLSIAVVEVRYRSLMNHKTFMWSSYTLI